MPGADAVAGVLLCEMREIPADEWFTMSRSFKKRQAKTFGDGGGDNVAGVSQPRFKTGGCSSGWGEAIDDVEPNGQAVFDGEFPPSVVDGQSLQISRGATDGDAGASGDERGQKNEFAKIFPPDTAHGGEENGGR